MKRLLLLCLTAAVLVSCLGLSAQAAPTLSWTEFYTMGDAASAHTRIDPIELDGTTTLFLPASVSRKAVPVYFTLSEKNAVVTATGSRGSVALKSGDTLDRPPCARARTIRSRCVPAPGVCRQRSA